MGGSNFGTKFYSPGFHKLGVARALDKALHSEDDGSLPLSDHSAAVDEMISGTTHSERQARCKTLKLVAPFNFAQVCVFAVPGLCPVRNSVLLSTAGSGFTADLSRM